MQGGSRPHLFFAEDGHYYAVKAQENPQGSQILVNELVCSQLLVHLGLPVPDFRLVTTPDGLIGQEVEFSKAGVHFGSRCPVDPNRDAVFTRVSPALLERTVNKTAFLGMVAFDKWISNGDTRQAIFFRDRGSRWLLRDQHDVGRRGRQRDAYAVAMIDHGFAFQAERWEFVDLPQFGFHRDRSIYASVRGIEDFEPWLSRIIHTPECIVDELLRSVPKQWFRRLKAREHLEALLGRLMERRKKVRVLIAESAMAPENPFPSWRGA